MKSRVPNAMGPAVRRAIVFITNLIKDVSEDLDWRLPSIRFLAPRIGVSAATLQKAIAILKSQGTIESIERSRIRISGKPDTVLSREPAKKVPRWQGSREAFERDILSGIFSSKHVLPTLKELQTRYGCSFETIKQILGAMEHDDVVKRYGKSFVQCDYSQRRTVERVVFITHRGGILRSALNQTEGRVIEALEHECIRRNLKLEIVRIDFYDSLSVRKAINELLPGKSVLGFIMDVWWFTLEDFRALHLHLLNKLLTLKKPVAILDELGEFVLPREHTASTFAQVFQIEGRSAGGKVGRLLLETGHRSIAYFSTVHLISWSRDRFEGISQQYSNAGFKNAVHPFVLDSMDTSLLHILALSGFTDAFIRKILGIHATKSQAEDQFQALVRFKRRWSPGQFDAERVNDFQKNLANLELLAEQNPASDFFEEVYEAYLRKAEARITALWLNPLFERAITDNTVTAWVCANDSIAFYALSYLRERNIAVPAKISVVGFDNNPGDALDRHLTTFDFNISGFVHNMLNFISRPPKPRGNYRHSPLVVDGTIMVRGTTGTV